MGRARSKATAWLPHRVYRGRSAYEYHEKDGRHVRLCPLSATRAEVYAAYERLFRPEQDTVSKLFQLYFEGDEYRSKSGRTRSDYQAYAREVLAVFGDMDPGAVTSPMVRRYLDLRGRIARVRANRERALLGVVYRWARERGYVEHNPAQGVRGFPEPPRDRYVTDEEYLAVWNVAPAVVRVAMDLAYLCAARQRDVLDLRWDAVGEKGILIRQGKTGARQLKLWTPSLLQTIAAARRLPAKVASMWVVHNRLGSPYSTGGFQAMWKRTRAKAGLRESYTFHDLKAKSISDYAGDKREFSGHASERMLARYDRKVPEVLAHERKPMS